MISTLETSLLTLIFVSTIGYLIIRLYFSWKERKKRSTNSLFGIEDRKQKKSKSPNFIVETLYNLSKAFYRILPMMRGIATKRSSESKMQLDDKLEKAGRPFGMDADEHNKLKVFCAFLFFFLLMIVALGNEDTNFFYYAIAFGFIGFVYPDFFISSLLQGRAKKISLELPDAMDFIALCLAAGMNFQLAVEEYVKRNNTILADEFDIFINDVQVGFNRIDSFEHLLARNESPEFRSFLSSVIQGEQLGTPLRPVIMNQAEELRAKRRSHVEKEIATAPTKMLFPLIMFILPAMLMIILGSVLLPAQAEKNTNMTLTFQNFVYYRVTPGVKVLVNGNEIPVYAVQTVKEPFTGETQLQYTQGAIESPEQLDYIQNYLKNNKVQQAWFARFDIPEGELVKYYISVIAHNGQRASDFVAMKYINFSLPDFDEKGVYTTPEKTASIHGFVTPGVKVKAMMQKKELPVSVDPQTGEFSLLDLTLVSKNNHIVFTLTDEMGLSQTIDRTIHYTGVYVNVSFSNSTTVDQYGILTGTATPNTLIQVYSIHNKKLQLETSIAVDETGQVKELIPIEPGVNQFQVFTQDKDGKKSPKIQLTITRSLTG